MIGAIAGDIIGSIYELNNIKTKEFPLFSPDCRFTDDTVLTIAVADVLLNGGSFAQAFYGGVPEAIAQRASNILDEPLRQMTEAFTNEYLNRR